MMNLKQKLTLIVCGFLAASCANKNSRMGASAGLTTSENTQDFENNGNQNTQGNDSVAASPTPKALVLPDLPYEKDSVAVVDGLPTSSEMGDYTVCTLISKKGLTFVNNSGLDPSSGYAAKDKNVAITLPNYVVSAKAYIQKVTQDDAGAYLSINGTRVMEFKKGTYPASTWTFDGQNYPISHTASNQPTTLKNWVTKVGGLDKTMNLMTQGFALNPGENQLTGNVADVYGSVRQLVIQLQLRALVPKGEACPTI